MKEGLTEDLPDGKTVKNTNKNIVCRKKGIYEKYIKRIFDIFCSGLALIVLSPVLLITALLVRLKLGSPVIFHQDRPGRNEKIFRLYKFRTMTDEKDSKGNLLPDEVRLTPFGKKLRSLSLDELPELWNIFKGDLSVVGPRPLLISYLPYYTERERKRHSVRPGLSGLSQVSGRNFLGWDKRLETDVQYVENISFLLDVKIIVMTVLQLFKHEDVAVDTRQVEPNFAEERRQRMEEERAL